MTQVQYDEFTGDYEIVDTDTGEVVDSVCDRSAALYLCNMYNRDEQ